MGWPTMRLAVGLLILPLLFVPVAASPHPTIQLGQDYPTFSKEGPYLPGETVTLTVKVGCQDPYAPAGECKDARVYALGGGLMNCVAGGGAFAGLMEYQIDLIRVGEKKTILFSCTMNGIQYGEKQNSGKVYVLACPGLSCDFRDVPSGGRVEVKGSSPEPTAAPVRSPGFDLPIALLALAGAGLLWRRRFAG